MKVIGVDHIGIAVESIEEALRFYRDRLGLEAGPIEKIGDGAVRICRLCAGEVELELIEAADWEATMQRHLPHRGPGVYHLGLRVADVDGAIAELAGAEVPIIDREPRQGEKMRVSFLSPAAACGTLIELVERKPAREVGRPPRTR